MPSLSHPVKLPITAVVPQTVTYKSCLGCVKSEKYAFLVTLRPLGSMFEEKPNLVPYDVRRIEVNLHSLKLTSVCSVTFSVLVPRSCVHTKDVPKKWILPSIF